MCRDVSGHHVAGVGKVQSVLTVTGIISGVQPEQLC